MREKSVHNLLFLAHKFLAFLQVVELALMLLLVRGCRTWFRMAKTVAISEKKSFHWEKVLLEEKTAEVISYRLASNLHLIEEISTCKVRCLVV